MQTMQSRVLKGKGLNDKFWKKKKNKTYLLEDFQDVNKQMSDTN